MPNLPSLKSLAELPDVPSPVLALVGAGDAAAEAARDLPSKLAAIDPRTLDPRGIDFDLTQMNPRNIDLRSLDFSKLDPRTIDTAALTATGLQWAAKSQEAYEGFVARGESVINKNRESEWADAVAEQPVAQPPAKAPVKTTDKTARTKAATPPDTTEV